MKQILVSRLEREGLGIQNILEYQKEIRAWNTQERMVKKTKDEPDEAKKYASYPFPIAHELIVDAVTDKGELDFEIIDDTIPVPEPEPSLEEKKAKLIADVRAKEQEMRLEIVPLGKARLISMHEVRIINILEDERDEKDKATLAELQSIREKMDKISWWAAEQESEIADLTEDNIKEWVMYLPEK